MYIFFIVIIALAIISIAYNAYAMSTEADTELTRRKHIIISATIIACSVIVLLI